MRWAVTALLLLLACGCRNDHSNTNESKADVTTPAKFLLRDDTPNLMLTWIDSTGDFHVVSTIAEVPAESREQVRVVATTQADGTGDFVYVADLRSKDGSGNYTTTTITRSAWEESGASRRKARMDSLAPVPSQLVAPSASQATVQGPLVAVIYGAEWCGACREAERYLKTKGVKVLEKDVDQSPAVQAELRAKLAKAGMPATSSIPIIDIGGKLLVGFSKPAVDSALKSTTNR